MKFGQRPCTIVQGLWSDFGATLKIRKKSNFDQNQRKISTQVHISENALELVQIVTVLKI